MENMCERTEDKIKTMVGSLKNEERVVALSIFTDEELTAEVARRLTNRQDKLKAIVSAIGE